LVNVFNTKKALCTTIQSSVYCRLLATSTSYYLHNHLLAKEAVWVGVALGVAAAETLGVYTHVSTA
jgi:hypothetical protein